MDKQIVVFLGNRILYGNVNEWVMQNIYTLQT